MNAGRPSGFRQATILTAVALMTGAAALATAQAPPEEPAPTSAPAPGVPGAPTQAVVLPAAEISTIDDLRQVPEGYWSQGTFGDFILSNGLSTFVFGRMPDDPKEEVASRAGALIDIFPSPRDTENFDITFPVFSKDGQNAFRAVKAEPFEDDAKGTAGLRVEGTVANEPTLRVVNEFLLERGRRTLTYTTTVTNSGSTDVKLPVLSDFVNWATMGVFVPTLGWAQGNAGEAETEFVYGRYFDTFVLFAPTTGFVKVRHNGAQSQLSYRTDVTIKPGESVSFSRNVGSTLSTAAPLWADVLMARGDGNFGTMVGRLIERVQTGPNTTIDRDVARNTEVELVVAKREGLPDGHLGRVYIRTTTDDRGIFSVALPPGEYGLNVVSPMRHFLQGGLGIPILKGQVHTVDVGVSPPAALVYEIVDAETKQPIPGKVSLVPLRGSRVPYLGDPGGLVAGDAAFSRTGRGIVPVMAGNYRVIASHGIEFDSSEQRVSFEPGKQTNLRFELRRAFETPGLVAADIAVRTNASPDVRTSGDDRVVTAAAEGLDWIVSADEGMTTNLQPIIERFGLSDRLRASVGFRSFGTRIPLRGDFLVFPLETAKGLTAEKLQGILAKTDGIDTLNAMREAIPGGMTVLLRPVFPGVGYLIAKGGDEADGFVPNEAFASGFDGFQIWTGKYQMGWDRGYGTYQELLSRGFRHVPVAASDSGGTWNAETGYPRIMVESAKDAPASALNPDELVANLKAGRFQITNGPVIDFKVMGKGPGSTVTANKGERRVPCELTIKAANWVPISTITVNVNGKFAKQVLVPGLDRTNEGGTIFPPASKPDEGRFNILVTEDAVIDVVISSDKNQVQDPINPLVVPTPDRAIQQGQHTLAMTAPIYVDFDGDGKITLPAYLESDKPRIEEHPPFD